MAGTVELIGIACGIAAIIGGGLTLAHVIHIPVLHSVPRQVLLFAFGVVLIFAPWENESQPPVADRDARTTTSARPALSEPSPAAPPVLRDEAMQCGEATPKAGTVRRSAPAPIHFRRGVDLDCGTVTASETSAGADISGRREGDVIDALNPPARGTRVARLDVLGEADFDRCGALSEDRWAWSASGLSELPPSGGLCVRTSEGNIAIVKFDRPSIGPLLHIRYRLKYLN